MQGLVDGDLIAQLGQVACGGQTGRASADDGDLVAVPCGHDGGSVDVFAMPVGHKALQAADAHGLVLDAAGALALALALLGADTAADGGQGGGAGNDLIGGFKVALGHMTDELGDIDAHGAAGLAGLVLAVDAALCLVHGHLFGIAQCNFLKVLVADVGSWVGMGHFLGSILKAILLCLLSLEQIAGLLAGLCLKGAVHGAAGHGFVEIDEVTVKVGAVHAGKLGLAAHGQAAAAAHAGAVDHNGVHGDDALQRASGRS